jgi:hypothetical protein
MFSTSRYGGDFPGVVSEAADPFRIPEMMEVDGSESISDDPLPISSGIVIVGRMKGLMKIADQMEYEFRRDQPFFGIGGELLDLSNDAGPPARSRRLYPWVEAGARSKFDLCFCARANDAGSGRDSIVRETSRPG